MALRTRDASLGRLVGLASRLCHAPTAFILTLGPELDILASTGLPGAAHFEDAALARRAASGPDLTILEDLAVDPVHAAGAGAARGLRFFAAAPLPSLRGGARGALCIADPEPREPGERQLETLRLLAEHAAQAVAIPVRLAELVADGIRPGDDAADRLGEIESDPARDVMVWSNSLLRIAGLREQPGSRSNAFAGVLARDPAKLAALRSHVAAGQRPGPLPHRVVRPDGAVRWLEAHLRPRPVAGEPEHLVAVIADVTTLRLLSSLGEELAGRQAAQAEQQDLLDHMAVATARLAPNGTLLSGNPSLAEQLEAPLADLIGTRPLRSPRWTRDPATAERLQRTFDAALRGGRVTFEGQAHTDRGPRWIQMIMNPVEDERGKVHHVIVNSFDLSETRRTQDLLDASQRIAALGSWEVIGDRLRATDQLLEILGLTGEPTREEAQALVHPDDRARLPAELSESISAGVPWAFRVRMRRADNGRALVVETRGQGSVDESGVVSNWGTLQDVTDIAASEDALRAAEQRAHDAELEVEAGRVERAHLKELEESNQRLQAVIDGTPSVVYAKDLEGRYLFVNRRFKEYLGRPGSEIVGRSPLDLSPGADSAQVDAQDRRVLAGESVTEETAVPRPDGAGEDTYMVQKFPLRDKGGEIYAVCGIASDISEQKTLERERARRAARQALVGSLGAEVAEGISKAEFAEAAVSAACAGLGGRAAALFSERPGGEPVVLAGPALTPESDPEAGVVAARAIARAAPVTAPTAIAIPVPGEERSGCALVVLLTPGHPVDESGLHFLEEIARLLAIARGRAHARELEAQLARAQRLKSVGKLAGGVAHDFNNLLSVIMNYAAFVQEGLQGENEELREDVREIVAAAERAADLTQRLLLFGRGERDTGETCLPNEVLADLAEMLRRTLGPDVTTKLTLDPAVGPVAMAEDDLEQVVVALAVNAREAMPEGGTLRVETAGTPEGARILVADDGDGMPADALEHALEPFFTTKPHGQGNGLGLSTVHGLVRRAGGLVELSSRPGEGTTVALTLSSARAAQPGTEPGRAPSVNGDGTTVLLVEDEDGVREVVRRILEAAGYRVLAADGAARAREIVAAGERFDLLLSDVVMPGETGPELIASLPGLVEDHAVLLMSGYADDVLDGSAELPPEIGLVEKPFTGEVLLGAVASALAPEPTRSP